jgi:hypothetical protein
VVGFFIAFFCDIGFDVILTNFVGRETSFAQAQDLFPGYCYTRSEEFSSSIPDTDQLQEASTRRLPGFTGNVNISDFKRLF